MKIPTTYDELLTFSPVGENVISACSLLAMFRSDERKAEKWKKGIELS